MIYLSLLWLFFSMGIVNFGGGYAMLPLMQKALSTWVTPEQFNDLLAISQATPGPFAVNMATYVGFISTSHPFLGAFVATAGLSLPSFILCLIAGHFFDQFKESRLLKTIFMTLRPTAAALILWAGLTILKNEIQLNFSRSWVEALLSIKWTVLGLFFMMMALIHGPLKNRAIVVIFLGAALGLLSALMG